MLSRVLDPRDGQPRDPVFWLVLAAVALSQLLALWVVCANQVKNAEARRTQVQMQRVAAIDCGSAAPRSKPASCSQPHAIQARHTAAMALR